MKNLNLEYDNNVFINCPFDDDYKPIFDAIVFTVYDCGFNVRCSKEEVDSSQVRIEKIYSIISCCKYGIHDISKTELDPANNLPRFNMPLELGIFLGAKRFGASKDKKKNCLILDKEEHRYQKFISDISGQDIKAHKNNHEEVVKIVRNWLSSASHRNNIPLSREIFKDYLIYLSGFAQYLKKGYNREVNINELTFNDYVRLVSMWLEAKDEISMDLKTQK